MHAYGVLLLVQQQTNAFPSDCVPIEVSLTHCTRLKLIQQPLDFEEHIGFTTLLHLTAAGTSLAGKNMAWCRNMHPKKPRLRATCTLPPLLGTAKLHKPCMLTLTGRPLSRDDR
jgi:hypothetical protein